MYFPCSKELHYTEEEMWTLFESFGKSKTEIKKYYFDTFHTYIEEACTEF